MNQPTRHGKQGHSFRGIALAYPGKSEAVAIFEEGAFDHSRLVNHFGHPMNSTAGSLIHGDNLPALKALLPDLAGRVKLIYIDPPFATRRVFKDPVTGGNGFDDRLSGIAYLEFLKKRLVLLHRLLSEDGALYVHLSPHVAYLVRVILDEIFGKSKHQKTIIWKRASCHPCSTRFACIHDQILFYPKRNHRVTPAFEPLSPKDIESRYSNRDPDGRRFTMGDLTGKSLKTANDPRYHFTFHGIRRIWRYTLPTMRELEARGLIYFRPKGVPRKKIYLDQSKGVPPTDVWTDIPQFVSSDARVNFPTQKPERLLERIIRSSSKQGDLVLDAFCGSGTTLVVAEKLGRNWIGIDSGESAIKVTRARLGLLRVGMGGERENLKPYSLYQVGPNEKVGNHGQSE